jgi:HJR/Mrr/RecB family endonuclease
MGLSPRDFEHLVGALFRKMGCATTLTKASRDSGFDIILLHQNEGAFQKAVVECKCRKNVLVLKGFGNLLVF